MSSLTTNSFVTCLPTPRRANEARRKGWARAGRPGSQAAPASHPPMQLGAPLLPGSEPVVLWPSALEALGHGQMRRGSAVLWFAVCSTLTLAVSATSLLIGVGVASTAAPGFFRNHIVLMPVAFVLLAPVGAIAWRSLAPLGVSRAAIKATHAVLMTAAAVSAVAGVVSMFLAHEGIKDKLAASDGEVHLESSHSWLGAAAVTLFVSNGLAALLILANPYVDQQYKAAFVPLHTFCGTLAVGWRRSVRSASAAGFARVATGPPWATDAAAEKPAAPDSRRPRSRVGADGHHVVRVPRQRGGLHRSPAARREGHRDLVPCERRARRRSGGRPPPASRPNAHRPAPPAPPHTCVCARSSSSPRPAPPESPHLWIFHQASLLLVHWVSSPVLLSRA